MDDRQLLQIRTRALANAAQLAWPGVDRAAADGKGSIDGALFRRVAARVELRAENLTRHIRALEAALEAGHPMDRCWRGYGAAVLAAQPIFAECLSVQEGVIARSKALDRGMCRVADRLLDEICDAADMGWRCFTVLGGDESYTHVSDVIRVRFPGFTVWDLPVTAHELGHHAAIRLTRPTQSGHAAPFREIIAGGRDQYAPSWLEEHFADAFAAMTVGPAYACTCLLLRFDPLVGDSEDHPSDDARAAVMLEVLRRAAADVPADERAQVLAPVDWADRCWALLRKGAGSPGGDVTHAAHEEVAALVHAKLRDALPEGVRYAASTARRGRVLARQLAHPDYIPAPGSDDRMVHALDAAWRARTDAGDDEALRGRVTSNAHRLVNALAS